MRSSISQYQFPGWPLPIRQGRNLKKPTFVIPSAGMNVVVPAVSSGKISRLRLEMTPTSGRRSAGAIERRHRRTVTSFFFLLSFLANPVCGLCQTLPPVGQKPAPAIGAPANPFQLKTLDGKPVGLESFRGKPLIVNFFASWCDPCREEMPFLNQLASKSAKDGYAVLGIAVEDTRAALTEYVEQTKIGFPVALDLNNTVKRAYHIFGPPATFFIDGRGVIRDIVIGPVTADRAREGLKKAGAAA